MEEFYNLLEFSRRAAVFTIRAQAAWAVDGLTAVAMLPAEQVDWRRHPRYPGAVVPCSHDVPDSLPTSFFGRCMCWRNQRLLNSWTLFASPPRPKGPRSMGISRGSDQRGDWPYPEGNRTKQAQL